jgi:hypothetical protein
MAALSIKLTETIHSNKIPPTPAFLPMQDIKSWGSQIIAQGLNFPLIHCSRTCANISIKTIRELKHYLLNPATVSQYFLKSCKSNAIEITSNRVSKVMIRTACDRYMGSNHLTEPLSNYGALFVSSSVAARFDLASIPMPNKTPSEVSQHIKRLPIGIFSSIVGILITRNALQMQIANPSVTKTTSEKYSLIGGAIGCHLIAVNSLPSALQLKQPTVGNFFKTIAQQFRTANPIRLAAASSFRFSYSMMVALTSQTIFNAIDSNK